MARLNVITPVGPCVRGHWANVYDAANLFFHVSTRSSPERTQRRPQGTRCWEYGLLFAQLHNRVIRVALFRRNVVRVQRSVKFIYSFFSCEIYLRFGPPCVCVCVCVCVWERPCANSQISHTFRRKPMYIFKRKASRCLRVSERLYPCTDRSPCVRTTEQEPNHDTMLP